MTLRCGRLPWPSFKARPPLLASILLVVTCCCGPRVLSQLVAEQDRGGLLAGRLSQQIVGTTYSYYFRLLGRDVVPDGDPKARAKASLNITLTRAGPSPSYRMAISLQLYNYNLSGLPEGVVVYRGSRYSTGKALTGFIGSWTQLDPPGSEADYTGIVPNTTRVNVKAYNCTLSKALEYLLLYPGYNYVVVQQSLRRNGSVRGQLVKTLGSP